MRIDLSKLEGENSSIQHSTHLMLDNEVKFQSRCCLETLGAVAAVNLARTVRIDSLDDDFSRRILLPQRRVMMILLDDFLLWNRFGRQDLNFSFFFPGSFTRRFIRMLENDVNLQFLFILETLGAVAALNAARTLDFGRRILLLQRHAVLLVGCLD